MLTLLLAVVLGTPPPAVPPVSFAPTMAVIRNSGSTNAAAYAIGLRPDGVAIVAAAGASAHRRIPHQLAARFFADVRRAGPLDALPAGQCMKSASFGATTTILYRGRRSPDLSCPQGDLEAMLAADIDAVVAALHVP